MEKKFKLCYIDNDVAYFTSQNLSKQWGDDWNDAPYEHNAGTPYTPSLYYFADGREEKSDKDWNKDGTPKWEIKSLLFESWKVHTPDDKYANSPYSVEDINKGKTPWLQSEKGELFAGATIQEFVDFIKDNKGNVYQKIKL